VCTRYSGGYGLVLDDIFFRSTAIILFFIFCLNGACHADGGAKLDFARNFILLSPPDLPSHCDGCGHPFTVQHGLACSLGGLVLARHNELRDELADLAA